MAFDNGAALGLAAFNHIGIDGALRKMVALAKLSGLLLKYLHKVAADDLALGFGIGNALEVGKETISRVNVHQLHRKGLCEDINHLVAFAGAHKAVIHIDAGKPAADGAVEERGSHGAVNPAGKAQKHRSVAHLLADLPHGYIHIGFHAPIALQAANVHKEVAQNAHAFLRMRYFGVELYAVKALVRIGHGGHGAVGSVGDGGKALRRLGYLPGMAHPALALGFQPLEQAGLGFIHRNAGTAIFALRAFLDGSAVQVGHQLHAVANAQHRHAEREYRHIDFGRVRVQHAGGAAA